jgi:ferredoxin-type protein NapG
MDSSRRQFLREAFAKTSKTVVDEAERRVAERAKHFIRPPFALGELEFLLGCTRCDACIEQCTHGVLFPLRSELGAQVAGTPAMDLLNKGCHLCEDWPCVNACEPKALQFPDTEPLVPPKLAKAWIDTTQCLPYLGPECGVCAASCPVEDALLWEAEKPVINHNNCTGCGLCREACITEPKAIRISSLVADTTQ